MPSKEQYYVLQWMAHGRYLMSIELFEKLPRGSKNVDPEASVTQSAPLCHAAVTKQTSTEF